MNEILKRNGLPTEGAAHITINLIKLIAEQYAKEKAKEVAKQWQDAIELVEIGKTRQAKRIKELEDIITNYELKWLKIKNSK